MYFIFADFCCEFHVNDPVPVKMECIACMGEVIDSILSQKVCSDMLSNMFVSK